MASKKILKKTININKYNYDKNDEGRMVQLAVLLHILKISVGEDILTEIANPKTTCYIPYGFGMYETIAMVKVFRPVTLYAELDEHNYCEIRLEEIKLSGTKEFVEKATACFEKAQKYTSDINLYFIDFNKSGNDFMWNTFYNSEFRNCMQIGDTFIKNGSMKLYPENELEYYVYAIDDYKGTAKEEIEYIVLQSNTQSDKLILIDHKHRHIIASGLNELEQESLLAMVK